MARSRLSVCILAIAAVSAASPALAQFGSIFSDEPPRPPANVPGGAPDYRSGPPYYSNQPPPPPQQRPYYPSRSDQRQVQQPDYDDDDVDDTPRPPRGGRADEPPAEPLPAPMSLPPANRPGAGGIQTQDLAPPPGTAPPQTPAQAQPQPGQGQPQQGAAGTNPVQTLPGLPPGVRQPPGTPQQPGAQQPASNAPQGDEVVVEPPPQRIANPTAVFSGLDKITGRIISFDVAINETVQFGALQVTPRVCYSRPPTETPNTDGFVEVDEVTLQGEVKRIFTGWMFAASPGLHAVEHPIYDVWLTDCKGGKNRAVADVSPDAGAATLTPAPKPPARAAAPRRAAPQPQQQPRTQAQPPAQQQQPGFFPGLR